MATADTVSELIKELKANPKDFRDRYLTKSLNKKEIGELIKKYELGVGLDSAHFVLKAHERNTGLALSAERVRSLLSRDSFKNIIKNKSTFFTSKDEAVIGQTLRKLLSLQADEVEAVAKALKRKEK